MLVAVVDTKKFGRRENLINTRTSNWEENGRHWLKSATYFKSLVPT